MGASSTEATDELFAERLAKVPVGEDAMALSQCDLVMKGGITSGIVYPGAAVELARRYRFRSLGGSSAGAIAAGLCAAAEYGRWKNGSPAGASPRGMTALAKAAGELTGPGFLARLFQCDPAAPPQLRHAFGRFQAGLPVAPEDAGWARRKAIGIRRLLLAASILGLALAGSAYGIVTVGVVIGAFLLLGQPLWVEIPVAAVLGLFLAATLGIVALAHSLAAYGRDLPGRGFGICSGMPETGNDGGEALIPWLHGAIQSCAGLPGDEVLTFAHLGPIEPAPGTRPDESAIGLRMTATDLAEGHPVIVPDDLDAYWFEREEMLRLFPRAVVDCMCGADAGARARGPEGEILRRLDRGRLPVVVGLRLSLSFPLLLSSVRLWKQEPPGRFVPHQISDGGIASNFPIHFFDAWVPSRPTFGLDLISVGEGERTDPYMLDTRPREKSKWGPTRTVGEFGRQVKDAGQNWRDLMQSQLDGFRERVCRVPLGPGEGGLNLAMAPETIRALIERGFDAGELLGDALDPVDPESEWLAHRDRRYLMLMREQQLGWEGAAATSGEYFRALPGRWPDLAVAVDQAVREPRADRLDGIRDALHVLRLAANLGDPGAKPDRDFGLHTTEEPASLRIVPRA